MIPIILIENVGKIIKASGNSLVLIVTENNTLWGTVNEDSNNNDVSTFIPSFFPERKVAFNALEGKGFGFSLSGDVDKPSEVFISKMVEDGAAKVTGALQISDQIISINDRDTVLITQGEF